MTDRKTDNGKLAAQIDFARRNLESWPSWLKEGVRQGDEESSHEDKSSNSRRASGEAEED